MPDLASMAAHESSMDTVPIIITTSSMRSSSAEPGVREQTVGNSVVEEEEPEVKTKGFFIIQTGTT